MTKTRLILIITTVVVVVSSIFIILYFASDQRSKNNEPTSDVYPSSVVNVINKPVEKITDNYFTLIKDSDYFVSYGGNLQGGTFYITVNAEPVVSVSKKAEQALLKKLQVDESYACTLTVILNVPSIIDSNLSEYDFGLSFCPGRPHVEDVPRGGSGTSKYDEIRIIPSNENFSSDNK